MKVAIIDDQIEFLEIIKDILSHMNYEFYSFTSVFDMEKTNIHYDLILLDIDMPDCDGINYSKKHLDQNIVFITSQNHRMKEAFGNNVYGFIEKNDDEQRYHHVIYAAIDNIFHQKTITLKSEDEIICFDQKDIVYLVYVKYKTISLLYRNKLYTIKGYTLSQLEEKLDTPFLYASRDMIINANMIVDLIGDKLYLRGVRQYFLMSRRRKNDIKAYMMEKNNYE